MSCHRTSCRFLGLLGVVILLCACSGSELREQPDWEPILLAANEALLNQGAVEMVPQFFSESYISHESAGDIYGLEGVVDFLTALRDAFPDLFVDIEVLATEGDRVAWLRTSSGTHEGEFMGVPATGRFLLWQDMIVTRVDDGLIVEEWGVSGLAGSLVQP